MSGNTKFIQYKLSSRKSTQTFGLRYISPSPAAPGETEMGRDLLLPTFLQLHSPLSARLAACGSLLSLLPPLQAPPAQSNGGTSKYQQIWIGEQESVFQKLISIIFYFCISPRLPNKLFVTRWCLPGLV